MILDEEVHGGNVAGLDGGLDVVELFVRHEVSEEFELSLGFFFGFGKVKFVDADCILI